MDVYCAKCAEPWDVYTVYHELGDCDDGNTSNKEAHALFAKGQGCPSCRWGKDAPKERPLKAEASSVMMDLLGDDLDGVASMMDDCEYMGMV